MPDATFPQLHIRPERGWLNDPNGVCRIDGTYHVFFQYNPNAPTHGDVHWAHVSSPDLLHWTERPVALRPRPGMFDAGGCWSGCVVDDGGVPTAVYTANPDHARNAAVGLARSDRSLDHWVQASAPVIGPPVADGVDEVRDPFVFTHDGRRYAVQGAGRHTGPPCLLLWGCDDLDAWVELGPLLTFDDPVAAEIAPADIWECPNLALIDDRWVLLLSLWRWVDGSDQLSGVRYLIGDLENAGPGLRFRAETGGVVDDGPAFYAPQLLVEPDRTLLWGWAWELGRSVEQVAAAGWAGLLTLPRELFVSDGVLGARPAAELVGLRDESLDFTPGLCLRPGAYEIVATGPTRLSLDGRPVISTDGTSVAPTQVFLDGSIIEVYSGGRTFTTRVYPGAASVFAVDATAGHVTVYPLRRPGAGRSSRPD